MTHEQAANGDPRLALQQEVVDAVQRFAWLQRQQEYLHALDDAIMDKVAIPEAVDSLEGRLKDYSAKPSRAAMELEAVLMKLHDCTISYNLHEPGAPTTESQTDEAGNIYMRIRHGEPIPHLQFAYVRNHMVEVDLFASWGVWLDIANVPPTREELERPGALLVSMNDMHDFRVLALPGEEIPDWAHSSST